MKITFSSRLGERGQVSLPVAIRHGLGLAAGQRVKWEFDTEMRVVTLTANSPLVKGGAHAALGFASGFRKLRRTAEWMAELNDGDGIVLEEGIP